MFVRLCTHHCSLFVVQTAQPRFYVHAPPTNRASQPIAPRVGEVSLAWGNAVQAMPMPRPRWLLQRDVAELQRALDQWREQRNMSVDRRLKAAADALKPAESC